jgi:hypothetical protein
MVFKKNEPFQPIGTILEEVLSKQGYLTVCKEYAIVHKWPSIVPANLAKVSVCERIENGILYVKVSTAPWRQEALYLKERILQRIQKEEGCPTIKDIVFF